MKTATPAMASMDLIKEINVPVPVPPVDIVGKKHTRK